MLVGCSIQAVYETVAHNNTARKGAAINMRRRRRLRLPEGPPGCSPCAEPATGDVDDSAASGGVLAAGSWADRDRRLIPSDPGLNRAELAPWRARSRSSRTRSRRRSSMVRPPEGSVRSTFFCALVCWTCESAGGAPYGVHRGERVNSRNGYRGAYHRCVWIRVISPLVWNQASTAIDAMPCGQS
jgi:hypothetical protein